jgi:hypothetical protein
MPYTAAEISHKHVSVRKADKHLQSISSKRKKHLDTYMLT